MPDYSLLKAETIRVTEEVSQNHFSETKNRIYKFGSTRPPNGMQRLCAPADRCHYVGLTLRWIHVVKVYQCIQLLDFSVVNFIRMRVI